MNVNGRPNKRKRPIDGANGVAANTNNAMTLIVGGNPGKCMGSRADRYRWDARRSGGMHWTTVASDTKDTP